MNANEQNQYSHAIALMRASLGEFYFAEHNTVNPFYASYNDEQIIKASKNILEIFFEVPHSRIILYDAVPIQAKANYFYRFANGYSLLKACYRFHSRNASRFFNDFQVRSFTAENSGYVAKRIFAAFCRQRKLIIPKFFDMKLSWKECGF